MSSGTLAGIAGNSPWNGLRVRYPGKAKSLMRLAGVAFKNYLRSAQIIQSQPKREVLRDALWQYGAEMGTSLVRWLEADDQLCDSELIDVVKCDLRTILWKERDRCVQRLSKNDVSTRLQHYSFMTSAICLAEEACIQPLQIYGDLQEISANRGRPVRGSAQFVRHIQVNSLRKKGNLWELVYEGEPLVVRDSKGIHYLALLLEKPNVKITASALYSRAVGSRPLPMEADGQLAEAGNLTIEMKRDRKLDRRAVKEIQSSLVEAREWLSEDLTPDVREKLEAQIAVAEKQLKDNGSLLDSVNRKPYAAIQKSVKRSIADIAALSEGAKAARHLRSKLKIGYVCSYQADPNGDVWDVQR